MELKSKDQTVRPGKALLCRNSILDSGRPQYKFLVWSTPYLYNSGLDAFRILNADFPRSTLIRKQFGLKSKTLITAEVLSLIAEKYDIGIKWLRSDSSNAELDQALEDKGFKYLVMTGSRVKILDRRCEVWRCPRCKVKLQRSTAVHRCELLRKALEYNIKKKTQSNVEKKRVIQNDQSDSLDNDKVEFQTDAKVEVKTGIKLEDYVVYFKEEYLT